LTAIVAVAAFNAKTLSPVEVMKAVAARCDAVNPAINALTHTFYDRALTAAARQRSGTGKQTAGLARSRSRRS
jgi:Asp-tRNA(Asn)/Glu-tRNA(Gln) amidotransferase A subunit family amidase